MSDTTNSKLRGAITGLCIGDALAMPVHWYYNRRALLEDYGWVTNYQAPRNPHPDSIFWRSKYEAANPKGEILHDQAKYWGQKGIHYHQFLKAGENTLNVKICRVLIDSIKRNGSYNPDDFLKRYIAYMTTPGNHRDTYIEECHRNFFTNYARGVPPRQCGAVEKHIGGLVGIIPIVLFYYNQPEKAKEEALAHLALTHPGKEMNSAGSLIIDLLLKVLNGQSLMQAITEEIDTQGSPFLGHPFFKWLNDSDEQVIGPRFSSACYVEDSVPAVIYLALKYNLEPEKALISNTNLGGDNAARGAVLGALLGAALGLEKFPDRWVKDLLEPLPEMNGLTQVKKAVPGPHG
jgi:ADP-ribosyl-[dinitrogen reductase] hydrolase